MRKLTAGFAVSLDGFIEGPNGEYDWIIYDKEHFRELAEHWKRTDAMFYGRKTYEASLAMQPKSSSKKKKKTSDNNPFAHMKHYVFSATLDAVADEFVLVKGDLKEAVNKIKSEKGNDIAVFGGAELVSSLINLDLVDELQLAIVPVILGSGKPFFINIQKRKIFRLKEAKTYDSGLVVLTYEK
ncbi:MAG TPA: dihydrofolate reductase family protein [Chitinophagaceae bacterium]|nr:dihydrofolate reductase family protein [Chitinophagaceae bacterium]